MIGLAQKHVPLKLSPRLAQAAAPASSIRVVVTDVRGRGVSGAEVSAWSGGASVASGTTDSSGEAALIVGPGSYDIRTVFGSQGYTLWSKAAADDLARGGTVFVEVPVCSGQPILTTSEIIALLAGAAITGAGFYWKFEPAKLTGEIILGAAIFTSLYRISCL